uniref:Telomere length and silencing protein 1 homolog n=1 Tax=Timema poppense TaxID=170557 RepID=A0A7R9CVI4_TIMPO|nr:unnamed protein product [Timema poppensis]
MANETNVEFKRKSKKPLRQRRVSSDESSESEGESETRQAYTERNEDIAESAQEAKWSQHRHRPSDVLVIQFACDTTPTCFPQTDPFKLKMGGMINMKALKDGNIKRVDDAYDTGIGTQFSAETNKRDEDEEMMKYIEEQLCKRKGKMVKGSKQEVEESESTDVKYCSPEEAALLAVPDHLRASSTQRSEEMLSNQMLSGIPEVDLGIDAKIRNIEATEEAKLKLLWERHSKKDGPSQFVPTNMAVNFVQHNRFNIEDPEPPKRRERRVEEKKKTVAVGSAPDDNSKRTREGGEKATDDYHYERFKKQFRRY